MELLLIRHALPVRRELTEGPADPELSDDGHRQAAHLADYLASESIAAVYASPLLRAVQTAQPVAARHGLPLGLQEGVAEWDRNASEYVPIEELKATNDPRWQALVRGDWVAHDETPQEFRDRTVGTIERLVEQHGGDRIAIVCHGGVINSYLSFVLDRADPRGFFYPNYTSIHRIAAARTGERSIVTVNETPHLRGTGLPMGIFQGS